MAATIRVAEITETTVPPPPVIRVAEINTHVPSAAVGSGTGTASVTAVARFVVPVAGSAQANGSVVRTGGARVRLAKFDVSVLTPTGNASVRFAELHEGAVQADLAWNGSSWVASDVLLTAKGTGKAAGVANGLLGQLSTPTVGTGKASGLATGFVTTGGSTSGTGTADAVVTGIGQALDPNFVHGAATASGEADGLPRIITPSIDSTGEGTGSAGSSLGHPGQPVDGTGAGTGMVTGIPRFQVTVAGSGTGDGTGTGAVSGLAQFAAALSLEVVGQPQFANAANFSTTVKLAIAHSTPTMHGTAAFGPAVTLRVKQFRPTVDQPVDFTPTVTLAIPSAVAHQPVGTIALTVTVTLTALGSPVPQPPIGVTLRAIHPKDIPNIGGPIKIWQVAHA